MGEDEADVVRSRGVEVLCSKKWSSVTAAREVGRRLRTNDCLGYRHRGRRGSGGKRLGTGEDHFEKVAPLFALDSGAACLGLCSFQRVPGSLNRKTRPSPIGAQLFVRPPRSSDLESLRLTSWYASAHPEDRHLRLDVPPYRTDGDITLNGLEAENYSTVFASLDVHLPVVRQERHRNVFAEVERRIREIEVFKLDDNAMLEGAFDGVDDKGRGSGWLEHCGGKSVSYDLERRRP